MKLTAPTPPIGSRSTRTKLDWGIVASCLLFIFAQAVSAYFEPPIRVLHTLQALIYVAVIGGALWHQKWAYGIGIGIAAFWNYVNLFVNTFIRNGVETFGIVISGGHVTNPGTIIAIPAALGQLRHDCFLFLGLFAPAQQTLDRYRHSVGEWSGRNRLFRQYYRDLRAAVPAAVPK